MTTEVATVTRDTPLLEVSQRMVDGRLSCLMICDDKGAPEGIVTERDMTRLVTLLLSGKRYTSLNDLMTNKLITANQHEDCDDAVKLMRQHRIRRLVVVDNSEKTCGLITRTDLLRAHTHKVEEQKQILEQRVRERTSELEKLNDQLQLLTITDPLLGVGNRRAMDQELEVALAKARRYQRPYSLALIDVDNFKLFNDHYGHQQGDEVLKQIASAIRKTIRRTDSVYRYGGEEFLVLLPEVSEQGGAVAAEHIRAAIQALSCEHVKAPLGVVTASLGVSEENIDNPNQLKTIAAADDALYKAKQLGRNQVRRASETPDNE